MFDFNNLYLLIRIYLILNEKNNILFLFWTTILLVIIIINFYINYRIGLIFLLTGFIFIRGLLVFFIYSILLFNNNFNYNKYDKNNILIIVFRFFLYKKNNNFSFFNNYISTVFLDFNNWWIFVIITFSFIFLIFLCFSVSKEKYI